MRQVDFFFIIPSKMYLIICGKDFLTLPAMTEADNGHLVGSN